MLTCDTRPSLANVASDQVPGCSACSLRRFLNLPLCFVFSFLFSSRGGRSVGERPLVRVSHFAVQSHPQLAGALPHESQLCTHRQVVRQTLRETREAHQQEVLQKSLPLCHCAYLLPYCYLKPSLLLVIMRPWLGLV